DMDVPGARQHELVAIGGARQQHPRTAQQEQHTKATQDQHERDSPHELFLAPVASRQFNGFTRYRADFTETSISVLSVPNPFYPLKSYCHTSRPLSAALALPRASATGGVETR